MKIFQLTDERALESCIEYIRTLQATDRKVAIFTREEEEGMELIRWIPKNPKEADLLVEHERKEARS